MEITQLDRNRTAHEYLSELISDAQYRQFLGLPNAPREELKRIAEAQIQSDTSSAFGILPSRDLLI